MNRLILFGATAALSLFTLLGCSPPREAPGSGLGLPPEAALITHRGEKVRFRELVRDQVVLVNFMYTKCNGACPGTMRNLLKVQNALGDHLGRDVFMYSISVDPKVDTPEVLARYAEDIGAKPGWTFLTGDLGAITRLRRRFGVYSRDPSLDADKKSHAGMLIYGNDALGAWASAPGLGDPETIVLGVTQLLRHPTQPEGPEPAGVDPADPKDAPAHLADR